MLQGPAPADPGRDRDPGPEPGEPAPAAEPGEPVPAPDPMTEAKWLAWCAAAAGQDEPGDAEGWWDPGDPPAAAPGRPPADAPLAAGWSAGFAGRITVTVPLATLVGLADPPGEIPGLGPVDPWLARDLARAAAGHAGTTWCVTITDGHGWRFTAL